jgi:shikimate dehydrogenase
MTQLFGLLANPAYHSKSPDMQNAAFRAAGIDAIYLPFEVARTDLGVAVKGLKALNASGFNVSTPFKTAILPYLDQLDPVAEKLQAVNTVKLVDGHLVGYSTDGDGFWRSVKNDPTHVVLLGTGGAARAIMATAATYGIEKLWVFNRKREDWPAKVQQVNQLANVTLQDIDDQDVLIEALTSADLVINATPVGMRDLASPLTFVQLQQLKQSAQVIDLIYRSEPTTLLTMAHNLGLQTTNGLPMLVQQGALSFAIWTEQQPDIAYMTRAVYDAVD